MGKYHIADGIAAEFGPQIGVRLGDNGDDFEGFDTDSTQIGLNSGGGHRLEANFYFQLRFGPGLSKVRDNTDLRNGVVSLVGTIFPLKFWADPSHEKLKTLLNGYSSGFLERTSQ